jgi:uncharacterized protein (DUF58 family)
VSKGRAVILFVLIAADFLFINYPGVKIILYAGVLLILFSRVYTMIVKANISIERKSMNSILFTGLNDESVLTAANKSIIPFHALLISDYADLRVSDKQSHIFLGSVGGGEKKDFTFTLYGRKRGKYSIGPTRVTFTDCLGLFSFMEEIKTVRDVIVLPRIYKIPQPGFKSLQPQGVIKNSVPIYEDPSIITGVREYENGDDIKKINWKISARHSRFYINTYQHSISSNSMVLLNLSDRDLDYREKEFYAGRLIEVCASLFNELYAIKQSFSLVSNGSRDGSGQALITPSGKSENHFISILTDLALIEPGKDIPLSSLFGSLKSIRWGLSVYLITTRIDKESLSFLMDLRRRGHSVSIIYAGPELRIDMSFWNIGFQTFYAEWKDDLINLNRL